MIPGYTVMQVDDNAADLELTQMAFQEGAPAARYESFDNPLVALKELEDRLTAKSGLPQLLLLDVNMPIMNGISMLEILYKIGVTKRTAVVMFTTSARPDDKRRCLSLGAESYLVKPEGYRDLVVAVRVLLWDILARRSERSGVDRIP